MTHASPVGLHDSDLSATYLAADMTSGWGQKRTEHLIRTELVSLIVAGVAGVTTWRVGGRYDLLAVVSAVAFLLALACTLIRGLTRPEGSWYAGRAAAESARTLGWRYAVGGAPFPVDEPEPDIDERFLERLREIVEQLADTALSGPDSTAHEITPAMRAVRRQDLATRRLVYKRDRIADQLRWYERRTRTHAASANRWTGVAVTSSALGVIAAAFRFFLVDVDLLGVLAACASAAIAWNQLNQHRNLVTAYAVTARELSIIRDRVDHVPDRDWARFVSDSEEAISREHTMWLARHGHIAPAGA
jgi:hypothetical protein